MDSAGPSSPGTSSAASGWCDRSKRAWSSSTVRRGPRPACRSGREEIPATAVS